MAFLEEADQAALLWLNGWVGHFPWLDSIVRLVVSDYLAPMLLSLAMLGMWFTGANIAARGSNQYGAMAGVIALLLANLTVQVMNQFIFRPRPFEALHVTLLFYQPVDSSFPANPAAVGFSVATAVWLWNRKVGTAMFALAALYSLSRVYAGVCYPTDILGGAAIGVAAGLLAAFILRQFKPLPAFILRLARAVYLA